MTVSTATLTCPAPTTTPATIPTLRQYADEQTRRLAAENEVTYTEVRALYPDEWHAEAWWRQAVQLFEAGVNISTTHWRNLERWQHTEILRTRRAQNDRELTQGLIWKMPTIK